MSKEKPQPPALKVCAHGKNPHECDISACCGTEGLSPAEWEKLEPAPECFICSVHGPLFTDLCPRCREPAKPDEPAKESAVVRFFIDHGMIHDRKTGRHVFGEDRPDPIGEALELLNEMHSAFEQMRDWRDKWANDCGLAVLANDKLTARVAELSASRDDWMSSCQRLGFEKERLVRERDALKAELALAEIERLLK